MSPRPPWTRRGQRDPFNLIISFSFKSFRLKLNFPRQLTKEEFSEFMNEWWIYCTGRQGKEEGERERGMHMQYAARLCLRFICIVKQVKFREIQASLNFVPESCSFMPWLLQHFRVHSAPFYSQYLGYFQCNPVNTPILSHRSALQDGWKMQALGFPHFLIHSDPHLWI